MLHSRCGNSSLSTLQFRSVRDEKLAMKDKDFFFFSSSAFLLAVCLLPSSVVLSYYEYSYEYSYVIRNDACRMKRVYFYLLGLFRFARAGRDWVLFLLAFLLFSSKLTLVQSGLTRLNFPAQNPRKRIQKVRADASASWNTSKNAKKCEAKTEW